MSYSHKMVDLAPLAAWVSPASAAEQAFNSTYVKFSLLALSSIFFLVDPFAAIPSFIAITSGVDAARRRRMAWKAALTCFIVLTSFALAGQFIFSLFGIKLPAFEIAGGLILLLIGIDMMEARRSPTQESQDETQEAAAKEDAGIVPLGIPMLAGPGAISSVMVLVGAGPQPLANAGDSWLHHPHGLPQLPGSQCVPVASASSSAKPASASSSASWACCWSRWPCSSSSTGLPISA